MKILKKEIKNSKAITLIALVVTIIILLILAGVTIGFAMNGTGLFDKAKLATDEYNNKVEKENYELGQATNNIEDYVSGNRDTITLTQEQYDHLVNKSAITVSSSTSAALNTSVTKYNYTDVDKQKGSNLTLDDGGIKIGKGIDYILVNAEICITGSDQACGALFVYKNNDRVHSTDFRVSGASTQWFSDMNYLVDVQEGDHIYFYSDRGSASATLNAIRMTVVEI